MNHPAAAWLSLLPEDDVAFILDSVLRVGVLLKKKTEQEREDRVSNRLRLLLRRDRKFRDSKLTIDREVPVYDDEQEEPIGKIDFRFLSPRQDSEWNFTIEAKRLHVTFPKAGWKDLVSEYTTGKQGMMCFIDERYSRGLASGAMVGYVYDGAVTKAREAVAASILKKKNAKKLKLKDSHPLRVSAILPMKSEVGESTHVLSRGDFVIYHLFLPV